MQNKKKETLESLDPIGFYDDTPALDLHGVTVHRGGYEVLKDIDLHVEEGVFLGIIGPNGGGKTTLLNTILGTIRPRQGIVEVFGRNPQSLNRRKQPIGYLPQHQPIPEYFPASVYDVVLMGAYGASGFFRSIRHEYKAHAQQLLAQVKLDHLQDRPIGYLSGGQQQRVFIARALVTKPRLLLLDEPLRGIDAAGQSQFFDILIELKRQYDLTVVMVTHDINYITRFSDRIACLNRTIHWHDRSDMMNEDVLTHTYQCELKAIITQKKSQTTEKDKPFKPLG